MSSRRAAGLVLAQAPVQRAPHCFFGCVREDTETGGFSLVYTGKTKEELLAQPRSPLCLPGEKSMPGKQVRGHANGHVRL